VKDGFSGGARARPWPLLLGAPAAACPPLAKSDVVAGARATVRAAAPARGRGGGVRW
jgi:hypothetical protein